MLKHLQFNRTNIDGTERRRDSSEDEYEVIRSCKSLQKHALLQQGTRDVSAQLFTALCRALGIPARLVVSVQSVPWKASVGKPKMTYQKKRPTEVVSDIPDPQEASSSKIDIKGKGKAKAVFPGAGQTLSGNASSPASSEQKISPVVKLRKQKTSGRRLGSIRKEPDPPASGYPPTQWTEVFSRPDGRWIPVDPIRNHVDKRKYFEPPSHDKRNRMVYVLAFEEDGYARDVTQR